MVHSRCVSNACPNVAEYYHTTSFPALQLLGMKASNKEMKQMLVEAGADESGEVGYNAFVRIMTAQLLSPSQGTTTQRSAALSFDTTVNEYRR